MAIRYLYPINFIHKKIDKQSNVNALARERKLKLSIHERVGDYDMAIDKQRNMLLHLHSAWKKSKLLVVDLKEVISCSVIKQYSNIEASSYQKNGLTHYLNKMFLHLRFHSAGSLILPIYNGLNGNRNIKHVKFLEEKVDRWREIVSDQLVIRLS